MLDNFINRLRYGKNTRIPDVMIIGVQKAATSSLYNYLCQHKKIIGAQGKETHFFSLESNYKKGISWYKNQFNKVTEDSVLLEATPNYLYYEKVAQRISYLNYKGKFIISLRDPILRAFSAWNMYYQIHQNPKYLDRWKKINSRSNRMYSLFKIGHFPSFEDLVNIELEWIEKGDQYYEPAILGRGFYSEQINTWIKYFDIDQFHFIDSENLKNEFDLKENIKSILNFINLDSITDNFIEKITIKKLHKREYNKSLKESISDATLYKLKSLYKMKNDRIEEITGLKFNWI